MRNSTFLHQHCLIFLFGLFLSATTLQAQSLSKYYIDNQRCSALLPAKPELEKMYYIDSSMLYMARAEATANGETYQFGAIVLHVVNDSLWLADEDAVNNFMEFYKSTQHIVETKGPKKTYALFSKSTNNGMSDIWVDQSGNQFTVQALASGNRIALLYIYGPGNYPNSNIQKAFFSGFKFPSS